ncbi:TIGR02391 family protein [Streptomyces sp. NPDC102415]|uniref:TIGR02391 family protein n=1 Tax=Streptomyces sp. NPDC102415 TaxID=3366173 RepID=UPI00382B4623
MNDDAHAPEQQEQTSKASVGRHTRAAIPPLSRVDEGTDPPGSVPSLRSVSVDWSGLKDLISPGAALYAPGVDREWMRQRLEGFRQAADEYWLADYSDGDTRQAAASLYEREPTVLKILRLLSPDRPELKVLGRNKQGALVIGTGDVNRGIGILADMDEWATRLAPEAPSLPADQLHAWVWDAARTFWESAHYRAAVHAAATSINAHLQSKVGRRDLADAKLVQEALSDKAPEPGKPRLRIPGDQTDPGVQTRQRGALQLGQGAYSALRNPAAHETGDLTEQEALEQLATFSVVARLIDRCHVVT